jgi:polysaccharide export outer membrane protein
MRKVALIEALGLWKQEAGMSWTLTGALILATFCGAAPALVWGASSQSRPAQQQKKDELPKPLPPRSLQPLTAERPSYAVMAGDVLRVSVWKEPDLTGDVTVRPDGKITLPLVGDIEVVGRSPQQLGVELAERLRRFVEDPRVTVAVAQANSARFYIIGQVAKPGVYPLTGRITVIQALALAGGFLPFAKKGEVSIVRDINGVQTRIPINYEKLEKGKNLQQLNVTLQGGDTIVVP